MTDEQQLIAEGLRDLHLPPPVSGWPNAPGWWVLVVLLLGTLAYICWWCVRLKRRRDPREHAVHALSEAFRQWQRDGSQVRYLQQSHCILRQLAIRITGRAGVSSLCGKQWVDWLEDQSGQPFPAVARFVLEQGAYQDAAVIPVAQLHSSYVRWARGCSLNFRADPTAGRHIGILQTLDSREAPTADERPYA